jgi:mannosyltransferase
LADSGITALDGTVGVTRDAGVAVGGSGSKPLATAPPLTGRLATTAGLARHLLVPGILATAASVMFLRGLGASSYFIDEATSLAEAQGSLTHVLRAVRAHETSPPTYALFLHFWIKIFGAHSETIARLPSALAAIGLVVAVWYLASLLADAPTALLAGLLTLISPAVLEYAQQARVYAILMLAATVSTIAVVKAVQESSRKWLVAAVCAAVATVSLHYFGWFVVGPLAVWLASRKSISLRARFAYCVALALAGVAWLPELAGQFSMYAHDGYTSSAASWAGLTQQHALSVLAAPLYGRGTVVYAGPVGAGILLATVLVLASPRAALALRARAMIVGLAVTPVVAILLLGLAGKNVVIPRYASIAVPFLSVAIAAATRLLHPVLSRLAAAIVLLAMMVGLLTSVSPSGMYPNARGVMRLVARDWQASDFVYPDGLVIGAYLPLAYYSAAYLPNHNRAMSSDVYSPAVAAAGIVRPVNTASDTAGYLRARARHDRLWIVADYIGQPPSVDSLLPPRYRAVRVTDFVASISLRLVLAVPIGLPRAWSVRLG